MHSIGPNDPRMPGSATDRRTSRTALWATVIGMAVLVLIFVFAIIQAANESSVLGWILAAIAGGWLAIAVYVLFMVRGTLRFGRDAMTRMENELRGASGRAPAAATSAGEGDAIRDQKIAHSFQIVLVQAKVLSEELDKGEQAEREQIDRAVDTINITAKNGMGMVRSDGPISGTVVD
ncbi:hypothetical protein NBM05_13730 [Rothia sp. AR01]|uniref:Uncharacterized protein n=1 Tax=Rothia santali TaxID=2949643 RepID=A0A9X2HFA0_9MICC|nr:hypothetical protein [Rothia santali]MCP3427040.1 hypothetical protein [Rothia santali]